MRINVYSQELLTTPMDPFMCVEKLTKENIDGESGQLHLQRGPPVSSQ